MSIVVTSSCLCFNVRHTKLSYPWAMFTGVTVKDEIRGNQVTQCEVGSEKVLRNRDWVTQTCHQARRQSAGGQVWEKVRSTLPAQLGARELPPPGWPTHHPPGHGHSRSCPRRTGSTGWWAAA